MTQKALVLATANRARDDLARAAEGRAERLFSVGDCAGPRNAAHAFYVGRKIGL